MVKKERILVLEDSPVHRAALKEVLQGAGYEVTAVDGATGVQLLGANIFRIAVISLRMAEADPVEAFQTARQGRVHTLAVAPAYASLEAVEACRLGATSVWSLPVDERHFLRHIEDLVHELVQEEEAPEETVVLLVEDNASTRQAMKQALETEGYTVLEAVDGREGLRLVSARRVSLVILDVNLPGKDGLSVCEELKSRPATSRLPVLISTVRSSDEDQLRAIVAAADDYLLKPFRPDELLARVGKLLGLQERKRSQKHPSKVRRSGADD